ncbi:metal ABC transporter permease [Lottiidibacillus patelloidae]|uniref:Metal ABC transporter permease n=1 Tax=Lottiidibacillus patelloidae TaxID=2670334 RepID=A0A263BWK9_9BACI|nr:metal ABC transporter permease [Lottiidibacillus patelloidae]OZM57707.1 metal ABC transporter permease [Lottiidibacillus patelloidae]
MISAFFTYDFLQNAFIVGILIGFLAPLIGTFIVVRRLSLIADALSHITLAGIAGGMLLQKTFFPLQGMQSLPLYFGMAFSVVGSVLIEKLRSIYKFYQELAIPILMSGGIGLSVIFISLSDGFNSELMNYLFGSVNAVSRLDVYVISCITLFVVIIIILLYKELVFLSFDEEQAKVSGVKAKTIHFLFIVIVALVISSSMRIVGILLVSSLMTLPVAASIRIANGFKQSILFSIIFGEIAVIGGLISAYHLSISPGGTIVVIAVLILLGSILWSKRKKK